MHVTINDAPDVLNTNDKAMWVLGYNESIDAVIKRLAAGVSVEPVWFTVTGPDAKQRIYTASESHPENCIPLYTATAIAAARVQALNDAMQAAGPEDSYQDEWFKAKCKAVEQIRVLLGKEPTWHTPTCGPLPIGTNLVTLDQLTAAIAAARVRENERIADWYYNNKHRLSVFEVPDAIRALLRKEPT